MAQNSNDPLLSSNDNQNPANPSKSSRISGLFSKAATWTATTAQQASKAVANAANTVGHSVHTPSVSADDAQKRLLQQKEEKKQIDSEMKWFDDIIDGASSNRGNRQVLSTIWKQITGENMLSRLTSSQQRKSSKIWGKLCHRCDISYPVQNKLSVIDYFTNISMINDIKYAVRHAIASYPPAFIVFLGLKTDVSYALKSTKKLLTACFGIESKDIIYDNCSLHLIIQNSLYQPSFYLAVDHSKKKIILSIRGSSSLSDALTDINASAKPFSSFGINGFVHEGIMASADFVFKKATPELIKTCNLYKDYQAIITGHSLGGGVAALLALMYKDHPVICKQNNLRVYPFASPCVISKEFIDKKICEDYTISVALSTDLVTRLSLEAVKQQNIRLDQIEKYDKNAVKQCLTHLKDDKDPTVDPSAALLKCLKDTPHPNPEDRLYPIGRILWFVPKAVMDDDIERRRKCLMCIRDDKVDTYKPPAAITPANNTDNDNKDNDNNDNTSVATNVAVDVAANSGNPDDNNNDNNNDNTTGNNDIDNKNDNNTDNTGVKPNKNYKMKPPATSGIKDIFNTTWNNLVKGVEEFQEIMDNSVLNTGGTKYTKQYDGSNYILCEATGVRDIFQELVLDLPESLYAHMPNRYMWACDAHLTRGNLNYDDNDDDDNDDDIIKNNTKTTNTLK